MIGYVTLGVTDLERAGAFYDPLLALLGASRLVTTERVIHWGKPGRMGAFAVIRPHDGQPPSVGNGVMVALATREVATVDRAHALALSLGGSDEGAPGPRHPPSFHGAYFRDPDGNKICIYTMVRAA